MPCNKKLLQQTTLLFHGVTAHLKQSQHRGALVRHRSPFQLGNGRRISLEPLHRLSIPVSHLVLGKITHRRLTRCEEEEVFRQVQHLVSEWQWRRKSFLSLKSHPSNTTTASPIAYSTQLTTSSL
ncbi:hypothetical protein BLNAU_13910 [Blattamonas nauphoetae]|uniref:Uncharacterized protein n=1 Tax=Blattamonas nauphoetae TaxID=2049346 RepID=A0ABQ9XFC4_9EUKA|nr:hypothetical protein BLNAU_13910 [Blattamonas nauphoetae]